MGLGCSGIGFHQNNVGFREATATFGCAADPLDSELKAFKRIPAERPYMSQATKIVLATVAVSVVAAVALLAAIALA